MRLLVRIGLLGMIAAPLAAQADPVQALADRLSLTADQADLVAEVYDARDPASLWTLAAELVPTLSLAQRDALMAPAARPDGDRPPEARGRRGPRGERRPRDPAQEAVLRAARDAALGLSRDQSARVDAALGALDRTARMQLVRQGQVPDALAEILTDDQIHLWQAHLALQRRLRRSAPR